MTSSEPPYALPSPATPTKPYRLPRLSVFFLASVLLVLSALAWLSLVFLSSQLSIFPLSFPLNPPTLFPYDSVNETLVPLPPQINSPVSLRHIVFGIGSSSHLWTRRREYISLWWRPADMRGNVWMDDRVPTRAESGLPPVRISEDISRFRYTNPTGHPSGLRIARIVAESFRLGYRDVRWFVLCDDDTIMSPENLVAVLSKYDWREMVYVGSSSESHEANTYFSHSMAFGGGGIAISYPLARLLAQMQDECLERYPNLYGSDDRLHACISELGIPLTHEKGFHQCDIKGNAHGLLAAHPIAPFVSIHHVEDLKPFYPGLNFIESLKLFTKAMNIQPKSFLQRSICYDMKQKLTISVSLGYVVQVFPNIVLPRDLERSEQTFLAYNRKDGKHEFDLDITSMSICNRPILFFLRDVHKEANVTTGSYLREKEKEELMRKILCFPHVTPLLGIEEIRVLGNPLDEKWTLAPRRLCCKINETSSKHLLLLVGECGRRKSKTATGFL